MVNNRECNDNQLLTVKFTISPIQLALSTVNCDGWQLQVGKYGNQASER